MLNFSANVGEIEQHLSCLEFNVIEHCSNWLVKLTLDVHLCTSPTNFKYFFGNQYLEKQQKKLFQPQESEQKKSFDVKTFHFSVHYNNEVKQTFLHFIMNLKGSHIWRHVFAMTSRICDLLLSPIKRHKTVCVVIYGRSLFNKNISIVIRCKKYL